MASYNIQRYNNDPEYREKVLEKQRAWMKVFKENNPDYFKKYYKNNKRQMNNYANEYHEQLRSELIMAVQGEIKCSLCPVTTISLLQLHHVKLNGKEDRDRFKQNGGAPDRIAWTRHMIEHYHEEKDKYPLQVLCVDCHKHLPRRKHNRDVSLTDLIA